MREALSLLVFILCATLAFYVYLGYPLIVALLARIRPRPVRRGPASARCTVVISAWNEGARLAEKVRAFRGLTDYGLVDEILVGSDGSTDDTVALLRAVEEPKLRVAVFPERRGKPSVLNDLVAMARSEVLVFTDARQALSVDALSALLENFADPGVGVVSGELTFVQEGAGSATTQGMRRYWGYEKWIRRNESAFRSVPGATGALYAMRRSLFRPLPPATLLDDVLLPMQAVRSGARCIFEGRALAFDRPSESRAQESRRKRRTLAGNLQLVHLAPWLIQPGAHPIFWEFVSHKLGRLLVPWAMLGMLLSCWWGRSCPFLHKALLLQAISYGAAGLGGLIAVSGRAGIWAAPWLFVALNGVAFQAWWDALRGGMDARWRRGG